MAHQLTSKEFSDYERDGYLVRSEVFDSQEIVVLRHAVENAVKRASELSTTGRNYFLDGKRFVDIDHLTVQYEPDSENGAIRVIEPAHELDPALDALVDDPRIVEPMKKLVGAESIALWTDKLNLKRPREGSGFGWHQDSPYWVHDSDHVDQLPNVYLALDDASEGNGCFRIIRASHTRGCLPGTDDGSQLGGFYTSPDHFDESHQVAFEVSAGSLVFFNAHTVHGSEPNQSDQPRRAFIITYQPIGYPMLKSGFVRNVG